MYTVIFYVNDPTMQVREGGTIVCDDISFIKWFLRDFAIYEVEDFITIIEKKGKAETTLGRYVSDVIDENGYIVTEYVSLTMNVIKN